MRRSPSLRRRTVMAGLVVVGLLLGCFTLFVQVNLERQLDRNIDALLQERTEIARSLAADHGVDELASRLERTGIVAMVAGRGGVVRIRPPSPALGNGPAGFGEDDPDPASRTITLADGTRVTVFASRAGSEAVLDQTRSLLLLGTISGLLLAALLLIRASALALRPIDRLVEAAGRIADGESGVRIGTTDADSDVGKVNEAFDQVTEALEAAVADANRSAEANRAFLADAAHQLRSPVTAMRAAVDVLGMGLDADEHARAMDLLRRQSERVGGLLTALLRLARIDMGEPPQQEYVDLRELCRAEVDRVAQLAPELRVDLRSNAASSVPIEIDPVWMREAIANLLDNARRHTATRLTVWLTVIEQDLELTVSDDGPGMSPEVAETAFRRFVTMDRGGGSGLGLPIARGIVEAHGGTLTYDGDRFVIRMQVERRRRARPPKPQPQVGMGGAPAAVDPPLAAAEMSARVRGGGA